MKEFFSKLWDLMQSRKFYAAIVAVGVAYETWVQSAKTPETTAAFIVAVSLAIGAWISAQGRVDAARNGFNKEPQQLTDTKPGS
jgi:hypothetical protein